MPCRTVQRALAVGLAGALVGPPAAALAHGAVADAPTTAALWSGWADEPLVWVGLLIAAGAYLALVRAVDRAHPANRVPRQRLASWLLGLGTIALALEGPIEAYATTLFSVHMVQHLLLALVAAPLLALGAPITLLLRAASPATRRKTLLPVLHSRVVRLLSLPLLAWLLFAAVMWLSHFSPLFDLALEDPLVHIGEHALFLGSGLLFWWPVVGADPSPWRLGHGARLAYLGLSMPQNTFLGLAIMSAPAPLYRHYASTERAWGPGPLADQQLAGGLMWVGGDVIFIAALVLAVAVWMRAEEAKGLRDDERRDRERARRDRRATT